MSYRMHALGYALDCKASHGNNKRGYTQKYFFVFLSQFPPPLIFSHILTVAVVDRGDDPLRLRFPIPPLEKLQFQTLSMKRICPPPPFPPHVK